MGNEDLKPALSQKLFSYIVENFDDIAKRFLVKADELGTQPFIAFKIDKDNSNTIYALKSNGSVDVLNTKSRPEKDIYKSDKSVDGVIFYNDPHLFANWLPIDNGREEFIAELKASFSKARDTSSPEKDNTQTTKEYPGVLYKGESAEEEAKKKNKIQFLQDENITNVESFMQWNKDSYKKLKVDPANEYNLKLFLNPKTEYGKKVFAGWGGSLRHEKDSIFNIDNVIDGGFANKISLTTGNKIEIDLNHKDFQKDGKQFEGKMLEAALINKLRAGNLEGIKKIGYINVDKNTEKIKKIYEKHIKIFSKNNGQTNYSTVKGPSEIELEEEDRKFFTSLETEKTVDKVEEELKKTAEIKLHEFINKSYQEYVKNHYKDNEKRKTGIYNKGSEKQKPLIIFPIGTRDVGGGGDEEAKNNYKSYTKYLKDNNMSVSSRNVYSVVSYGQYHWEFLKFQDNEEKPEKITNTGGGDNACGAYTLVGIITDDKELGNKLNINDLE